MQEGAPDLLPDVEAFGRTLFFDRAFKDGDPVVRPPRARS